MLSRTGLSVVKDGKQLRVTKGAVTGSLDVAASAERFKDAAAGVIIDGSLTGKNPAERDVKDISVALAPYDGSLRLVVKGPCQVGQRPHYPLPHQISHNAHLYRKYPHINETRQHHTRGDASARIRVGKHPRFRIWRATATFRRGESYLVEATSGGGKSSMCAYIYGAHAPISKADSSSTAWTPPAST